MSMTSRIEDSILLLKIKHGEEQAFAKLYDKYVDALYRFVNFRVPRTETTQDIVSELFLRVWQHLIKPETAVQDIRPFLYQSARNLVADYYRTNQEALPLDQAIETENIAGHGSRQSINIDLSLKEVEQGISKLKPEWQEVVVLVHVEGFKPSEVAEIIGKSPAATRVILHRAMQELKSILGAGETSQ